MIADNAVTQWINSLAGQSPVWDSIMRAVTSYGVPLIVIVVALHWWALPEWFKEGRQHLRHTGVAATLSFCLGLTLNQAILMFVHRPRPYDAGITHLLIPPSSDWSFPSDHATAAFAIAMAFALNRLPVHAAAFFAAALLVAWSRVFVGTHYLSDVIGGMGTGLLAAITVQAIYKEGSRIDRILTRIL